MIVPSPGRRRVALGAACFVAASILACLQSRGADTEHLRFRRPIEIGQDAAEELVAIRLDAPVLAATADGCPDLRILDGAGREVSRTIRPASVVRLGAVTKWFTVAAPRLKPLPGGGLEIEFTIDAEAHPSPIDGFRIVTPLRNFEQRVQVHRLDEANVWRPVGDDTLLYDYQQFMDTRQLDVPFPKGGRQPPGGTWRITVDETTIEQQSSLSELVQSLEGGEEKTRDLRTIIVRQPFRIDSIQAWHSDEVAEIRGAAASVHAIDGIRVEEEPKEQRTRIRVTTGREPITALRLEVEERNFSRASRVERPRPPEAGRESGRWPVVLGSARIHRVDLRGLRHEQLEIAIPESRFSEYEIVLDNGDSQPLHVTGVSGVGPEYEAVFLARQGESYELAYGGVTEGAAPFPQPRYDVAAIESALAAGQVPRTAGLGPVEERTVAAVEAPIVARLLNNQWLVGGAIALLVALLGLSLASAARRIDRPEGDDAAGG